MKPAAKVALILVAFASCFALLITSSQFEGSALRKVMLIGSGLMFFVAMGGVAIPPAPQELDGSEDVGEPGEHRPTRTWVVVRLTRRKKRGFRFPSRCACCGSSTVHWGKPLFQKKGAEPSRLGGALIDLAGLSGAQEALSAVVATGQGHLKLCDACFRANRWRSFWEQVIPGGWVGASVLLMLAIVFDGGSWAWVGVGTGAFGVAALVAHILLVRRAPCDSGVREAERPNARTLQLLAREPSFVRELLEVNEDGCVVEADWEALETLEREYGGR